MAYTFSISDRPELPLMALEPRILLDAAALVTSVDTVEGPDDSGPALDQPADSNNDDLLPALAEFETAALSGTSIVFIDAVVEDVGDLLAGIGAGVEVVMLDAGRDGVTQISDYLSGRSDISAIHIISHGSEGEVTLGTSILSSATLDTYADALAIWGEALSETGDILFYGCKVGANGDGQEFIDSIADLTGADIAASDDLTGAASLGGDWDLEVSHGEIDVRSPLDPEVLSDYTGILSTDTNDAGPSGTTNTFDGGMDFSGGNYLKLNADIGIDTNTMTIEAWIKITSDTATSKMIYSNGDTAVRGFFFMVDASERLVFTAPNRGTLTDTTTLNINQWYHVAATFDNLGKDRKIYIDGALSSTSATQANGPDAVVVASTNIGANDDGTETFAGYMTEVRVWNTTRSLAQISANKDTSVTASDADLAAYWKLNDMTGTTAADSHTNTATTAVKNMTQNSASETDWLNFTVPTVSGASKTISDSETVTFSTADFTSTFSDDGGQSLTKIQVTTLSSSGTLKLSGTAVSINDEITLANLGNLTFTPNGSGSGDFTWKGHDGGNFSSSATTMSITISTASSSSSSTADSPTELSANVETLSLLDDSSDDDTTVSGTTALDDFLIGGSGEDDLSSDTLTLDDALSDFDVSENAAPIVDARFQNLEPLPAEIELASTDPTSTEADGFLDSGNDGAGFMDTPDTGLDTIGNLEGNDGFGDLGGPGVNAPGPGESDTNDNTISGTTGNQGEGVGEGNAGGERTNTAKSDKGGKPVTEISSTEGPGGNLAGPGASDTNDNTISGTTGNQGQGVGQGNAGGQKSSGGNTSNSVAQLSDSTDTGLGSVGDLGGDDGFGDLGGPGSSATNDNTISGTTGNQGKGVGEGNAGGERSTGGSTNTNDDGNSNGEIIPTDPAPIDAPAESTPTPGASKTNDNTISGTTGNQGQGVGQGNAGGNRSAPSGNGNSSNNANSQNTTGDDTGSDTGLGTIGDLGGDDGLGDTGGPGDVSPAVDPTPEQPTIQADASDVVPPVAEQSTPPIAALEVVAEQQAAEETSEPDEAPTPATAPAVPVTETQIASVIPESAPTPTSVAAVENTEPAAEQQSAVQLAAPETERQVTEAIVEPAATPDQTDAAVEPAAEQHTAEAAAVAEPVIEPFDSEATSEAAPENSVVALNEQVNTQQDSLSSARSTSGQAELKEADSAGPPTLAEQKVVVDAGNTQSNAENRTTSSDGENDGREDSSLNLPVTRDGISISLTVPPDLFSSESVAQQTVVAYEANLVDGAPLPGWLNFNDRSGTFVGAPPPGETATLSIRVTAIHNLGDETDVVFDLVLKGDAPVEATVKESAGNPVNAEPSNQTFLRPGLSDQLAQGGVKGFQTEQQNLIKTITQWSNVV